MDIEALKSAMTVQRDLTQKAWRGLSSGGSRSVPDLARVATAAREQTLAAYEARIRALTAERDRVIARYDDEIQAQRRALEQMRRAPDDAARSDSEPPRPPGGPRKGKQPS